MTDEPEPPAAEAQAEKAERVARILERYDAERPISADAAPLLAEEVRQALDTLAGPDAPADSPPRPARAPAEDGGVGIGRWRRVVLALLAAGLIWAFWQRLAWIG